MPLISNLEVMFIGSNLPFDLFATRSTFIIIIYRPVMQDTGSDIEMDEVVFDFEDNSDPAFDETDQEEFGTGLMKISSPEDSSLLTEDQLFLVYLSPLLDLAATKIDSVCKMESCSRAILTKTNIIGSALYIIWVSLHFDIGEQLLASVCC